MNDQSKELINLKKKLEEAKEGTKKTLEEEQYNFELFTYLFNKKQESKEKKCENFHQNEFEFYNKVNIICNDNSKKKGLKSIKEIYLEYCDQSTIDNNK